MKSSQITVLMYGHDARLLESGKWALQSRGYRVQTATRLADFNHLPSLPSISLLVLCHTLSPKERADAVARASERWPGVKKLSVEQELSKPMYVAGKVWHTLNEPARLLSRVSDLVGFAASSPCSHIY